MVNPIYDLIPLVCCCWRFLVILFVMSRLFTQTVSGVVSRLDRVEERLLVCAPLVLYPLTSDISLVSCPYLDNFWASLHPLANHSSIKIYVNMRRSRSVSVSKVRSGSDTSSRPHVDPTSSLTFPHDLSSTPFYWLSLAFQTLIHWF